MFNIFRLSSIVIIAFMALTACTTPIQQEQTMYTLGIDLQEGFERDSIVVEINGKEIFQKKNVGTQLLLGYADTFSLKVPEGTSEVKIRLPLKNIEQTISLQVNRDAYVGISINAGNIEWIISDQPFYYQ